MWSASRLPFRRWSASCSATTSARPRVWERWSPSSDRCGGPPMAELSGLSFSLVPWEDAEFRVAFDQVHRQVVEEGFAINGPKRPREPSNSFMLADIDESGSTSKGQLTRPWCTLPVGLSGAKAGDSRSGACADVAPDRHLSLGHSSTRNDEPVMTALRLQATLGERPASTRRSRQLAGRTSKRLVCSRRERDVPSIPNCAYRHSPAQGEAPIAAPPPVFP